MPGAFRPRMGHVGSGGVRQGHESRPLAGTSRRVVVEMAAALREPDAAVSGPLCHEFWSRRDRGTRLPHGPPLPGNDGPAVGLLPRRQAPGRLWRCGGQSLAAWAEAGAVVDNNPWGGATLVPWWWSHPSRSISSLRSDRWAGGWRLAVELVRQKLARPVRQSLG
jgi:hypothetical protein